MLILGPYNACVGAFTLEFWGCSFFLGLVGMVVQYWVLSVEQKIVGRLTRGAQSRYPDRSRLAKTTIRECEKKVSLFMSKIKKNNEFLGSVP